MMIVAPLLVAVLAAAPQDTPAKKSSVVTLSGCVSRNTPSRPFTLLDENGARYRLSGKTMRQFAGQRVEVLGGFPSNRLQVRGGLVPSPNVAGQAGALDPTRAAQAGVAGSMTVGGDDQLPEFRVARVRALGESCE